MVELLSTTLFRHLLALPQHQHTSFLCPDVSDGIALSFFKELLNKRTVTKSSRLRNEKTERNHHPTSVKRGIVQGFVDRAIKVCSDEQSKKGEIGHIVGEMQGNGYPKKFIEKAVRDQLKNASVPRQSSEDEETNKEEWQAARIPFIEGVSYEVRRIAREAGIRCSFYQPQTLNGLYNVKDRLPSGTQRDVVYSVKCETCQDEYVGETMRALEVRTKEHRDAIRLNHPEKSAIAEHVLERNGSHDIDWHNVRVIDRATGMKERKVREAFAIEERKPAMNRDKGVEKSRTWNGLFT